MGRRGGGYHGRWCDCRGCKTRRDKAEQAENQRREDERNASNLGLLGDTMMGVAAVTGLVTDPGQQPDTNSLADTHQSQVDGYRQSIGEATHDQGRPSSQQ